MNIRIQTKEQQRSAFALEQIRDVYKDQVKKDTANFLVGVPTLILTNGLGQSLAFLLSKGDQKHKEAFKITKEWLRKNYAAQLDAESDREFLERITRMTQSDYLAAQQETLAMLQWLKRYARAFQIEDKN